MTNSHLFTTCGSIQEASKEYDSKVFVPVNAMKTIGRLRSLEGNAKIQDETGLQQKRPQFRRQRRQTLPNIDFHGSKTADAAGNHKQKAPLRLSRSLEFEPNFKRAGEKVPLPRQRAQSISLRSQQRVSFLPHQTARNQQAIKDVKRFNYTRPSIEQSSSDFIRKSSTFANRSQTESHSIPSDDITSIYSIVKARSLALKWYKANHGNTARLKKKQNAPLPTIDDKKSISLCKAKCSPQFAEVVHLLQDDESVEDTENDLQLLSLE